MAYIERRRVHDADAHIMEPPTWLRDHADPDIRDSLAIPAYANELAQTGDAAAGDAPDPDELELGLAELDLGEKQQDRLFDALVSLGVDKDVGIYDVFDALPAKTSRR